jgi:hypothetical protein
MNPIRLHVIACPVFQREIEMLAAECPTTITTRHLEMALHERPADNLHTALQAAIDGTAPDQCDAIGIAYGLCNRGIVGLRARHVPVVIPRAHDCIGLLLGSGQKYLAQLEAQPGTYFQSAGWLENSQPGGGLRPLNLTFGPNSNVTRPQLVEKYGEENADYLLEQFNNFTQHYQRLAYITTPVPEAAKWEAAARQTAQHKGWAFEKLPGDLGWLRRLLNAEWGEKEFLVLRPGEHVGLRSDELLIEGAKP